MVEQVRRFNRTVTQRIGALNDAFLARGRPLGQARLLWEIGPAGRVIGAPVELFSLGQPAAGEAGGAHPPVGPALLHHDEPVVLQRPQQPAEVSRVQVEP